MVPPAKPTTTIRPSNAMHLVDCSNASPPTGSNTTSAPAPPVSAFTTATTSCADRSMTTSAPAFRATSAFAALPTTPITRAPAAAPSCTAALPTPPAAACTSSVSPGCSAARRCSPNQAVWYADRQGGGLGVVERGGRREDLALVEHGELRRARRSATRPPGRRRDTRVTPSPSADHLAAQLDAGGEGQRSGRTWYSPRASSTSGKFTATARTRTSTCPGPGVGSGDVGERQDLGRLAVAGPPATRAPAQALIATRKRSVSCCARSALSSGPSGEYQFDR